MPDSKTAISELTHALKLRAEEKFGKKRVAELHSDIEQMAADLTELGAASLEVEDEP